MYMDFLKCHQSFGAPTLLQRKPHILMIATDSAEWTALPILDIYLSPYLQLIKSLCAYFRTVCHKAFLIA